MKTNTLLLLASLAVLATSASAASSRTESDLVVLPTYVVVAPRYLPVEKQINASLNELRQQARVPAAITTELPVLRQAQVNLDSALLRVTQDRKASRLAKS